MDTELSYKYKDGFHPDIKADRITLDKSIFKSYTGGYDCNIDDSVIDSLPRRLWNCKLVWDGDSDCKRFLDDLKEFMMYRGQGDCDEKFKQLHEWLMKQELVEIQFECY